MALRDAQGTVHFFCFIVFSVLNIRTLCVLYDGDPVVNRKYAGESEHLGYLANGKCAGENEHWGLPGKQNYASEDEHIGLPVANRKYASESEHIPVANGKCAFENEHLGLPVANGKYASESGHFSLPGKQGNMPVKKST